jgi:hypothetical protein
LKFRKCTKSFFKNKKFKNKILYVFLDEKVEKNRCKITGCSQTRIISDEKKEIALLPFREFISSDFFLFGNGQKAHSIPK